SFLPTRPTSCSSAPRSKSCSRTTRPPRPTRGVRMIWVRRSAACAPATGRRCWRSPNRRTTRPASSPRARRAMRATRRDLYACDHPWSLRHGRQGELDHSQAANTTTAIRGLTLTKTASNSAPVDFGEPLLVGKAPQYSDPRASRARAAVSQRLVEGTGIGRAVEMQAWQLPRMRLSLEGGVDRATRAVSLLAGIDVEQPNRATAMQKPDTA